ncbi:hypothetical protein Dda_3905 [Drechslerella dactyloides]|uniref:Uncharacterized protein n=1 Tax=Drechslerella dactyloides TaxID=74499 RepID=A0AAD6J392_DREDA|nr:hypothetical protein Dda_3905 [Drechslerella dactyloides]
MQLEDVYSFVADAECMACLASQLVASIIDKANTLFTRREAPGENVEDDLSNQAYHSEAISRPQNTLAR